MSLFFSILTLLVAIILIVFGVYNGRHIFKKNDKKRVVSQNEQDKNNIPVVPRHLRNLDSTDSGTSTSSANNNNTSDTGRRKSRKSKADIFVKPTSASPKFNDDATNQPSSDVPDELDNVDDLNAFDDFTDDVDISSLVIDDFDVSQDDPSDTALETAKAQQPTSHTNHQASKATDDDFMAEMGDFFDDADDVAFDASMDDDFETLFADNAKQPAPSQPVAADSNLNSKSTTKVDDMQGMTDFADDFEDTLNDSIDDFEDSLDDLNSDFDDDLDDAVDISNLVIGDDEPLSEQAADTLNQVNNNDEWLTDDLDDTSPVDVEASMTTDVTEITESSPAKNSVTAAENGTEADTKTEENDAFYNLAFATERLMPTVKTVDEPEFTENSPVLDQHLLANADFDQNSPLKQADDNLNITIIPLNEFSRISGKKLLKLVDDFGFKFGAMNMFHRYQNKDGSGVLWFSMMGLSKDGVVPFDLNTLPETTELKGLVMFLPLPHPKLLQGFDSMMSIAGLIARELEAFLVDEEGEPITREYKIQLRSHLQALESDLMAVSGF